MKTAGLGLAAARAYLLTAATATAAPFAPPTTIGWGSQPALGLFAGAALAPDGAVAIAGTAATNNRRQAVAFFGRADTASAAARGFGPSSGAFDVGFAANASGDAAMTFSVGHTAWLSTCHDGRCRPAVRVGRSALKPQSTVAVQPGTGRTIVLWRGRTNRGVNRLQWRVTTNARLGATHTLGEFGDSPQLATDASGTTVAVWLGDRRAGRRGVRPAPRRVGPVPAPPTVTRAPPGPLRRVTSDAGSTVAAWLTGPNSANPEQTAGTVQVATRTRTTRFGAPQSLGTGSTLSLAGSPDGHVVLAADRHVDGSSVVVTAARRAPHAAFGPLTDISPPQFVSDAFGATAAAADGGRALVSWASATNPSAAQPAGVFATTAHGGGAFGAPEQLADAQTATLPQPIGAAISPTQALIAWVGPPGAQIARAPAGLPARQVTWLD